MSDFGDTNGIFQGDLIIKAAIELSIEDMRKNPWVIDDVFSSLIENPILKDRYGLKEVTKAREFIMNNDIPIYMKNRLDKQEFPCITISIGESREDDSLATLGDTSVCFEDYMPMDIGKPIKFLVPPFNVVSYDKDTGIVEVPNDVEEYKYIDQGMIAVDPETGNGFIVNGKAGSNGFQIAAGSELSGGQLAIVPQYALYRARRERAISQEVYNIGCHVEGDPSTLIFLHSVVKYALYRYREGLLEYQNFQLSRLSSTDMIKNQAFDVENVYSRFIMLRGQVEESWVKSPKRFIEAIDLIDRDDSEYLKPGLKVLANEDAPPEYDDECSPWTTIDSDE
jgi:hypothetical protein